MINYVFIFLTSFYLFLNGNSLAKVTMNSELKTEGNMLLKIVQVGDPLLRMQARALTKEEIVSPATQQLIKLMQNTMRDAPGVGLAAPQVGLPLQLIVIEDRLEYLKNLTSNELKQRERHVVAFQVIINPVITILAPEEKATFFEGCLSLAGFVAKVPRALMVKVDCLNEKGEPVTIKAKGWYARILQHEIDHLHGTLNIDHMLPKTLTTIENYKKFSQIT